MIKLMDYVFFKIFRILVYLKKNNEGAKWSAFLYTGLYLTAVFVSIVCIIGLGYDNFISKLFKNNAISFNLIACAAITLLISMRYYFYKDISDIKSSYNAMKSRIGILVDILVYSIIVVIPILTFFLFRLYVLGHI